MTEEKQGAVELMREIAQRKCNCHEVVRMFGFACGESPCTECIPRLVGAIAQRVEKERALPDGVEWPRFEDGELVRIGDELEFEGKTMLVCDATFYADDWALWCDREDMSGRLYGKCGERVKRPAPKVLDADGVPIKVGDTVHLRSNGREGKVVGFYEDKGETWVGETWVSVSYELGSDRMTVNTEGKALTHEPADSWEKLEEDMMRGTSCLYFGGVESALECWDCPHGTEQTGTPCWKNERIDILKRAKKLAGIKEEVRND